MILVVDASVATKWFLPEVHGEAARSLLDGTHEFHAPDLLYPEVANVLWKRQRRGELSTAESRRILKTLGSAPIQIHPSAVLITAALEIALGTGRSVYDSLYLALATQFRCRLVTADRTLVNALASSPLSKHLLWVEDGPGGT